MPTLEQDLLSLVDDAEITRKDAANIILVRDGLKPFSSVGVSFSRRLVSVLEKHRIPFVEKENRIYTGRLGSNCGLCHLFKTDSCKGEKATDGSIRYCQIGSRNGLNFGFPSCCSSVFSQPSPIFLSKNPKDSFSPEVLPFIFHVPCSEKCDHTVHLAIKYKTHIENRYPVIAKSIEMVA